jgi:RES domain-containing protein
MSDKSVRELQSSLPWTAHYHRDFRATPMTHKDFGHALLHITKASGKLAAIIDDAEHGGYDWADPAKRADVEKYVADMVICALRMANTCPDGVIDLQRAVEERLTSKNNQLVAKADDLREAERK